MATKKVVTKDDIVNQIIWIGDTTASKLEGELLYFQDKYFGLIHENRLFIKVTKSNAKYNLPKVIPYEGSEPMYQIKDIDDREKLEEIVLATCNWNGEY